MKVSQLIFTLSLITASTLSAMAVAEQPDFEVHDRGRYEKHVPMQRMLSGLELTDSQKDDIKQLVQQHRAERAGHRPDKASREQLHAVLAAEQFNESAARQILEQRQQQRLDQELSALKLRHQVLQVLTPEQRQQLKNKHENWQLKRQQRQSS
jgi:periplasmic protein CpxP/Spy